jgi:hypothetical protein
MLNENIKLLLSRDQQTIMILLLHEQRIGQKHVEHWERAAQYNSI